MFENLQRPRYLEGYPRLDMVRAKAATDGGLEVCEFVDPLGGLHGIAQFGDMTDTHIIFEYEITVPYLPNAYSSTRLELVFTPNGVDNYRTITRCLKCGKPRSVLVYVEKWACSFCHGLMYRSQTLSPYTRMFERRNALTTFLKHGRPKGMHNATYVGLREDLKSLSARLKGLTDHSANCEQSFVIDTRWTSRKSMHTLFFSGEMGRDNY